MAKQNEDKATKQSDAGTGADARKTKRTIILAAIVVVAVGVTAGIAIYRDRVAPFKTVIVEVNGATVDMGHFLKRIALSGEQSMSLLSTLTKEEIIKQKGPQPPYNIVITDEDIDQLARDMARGDAETIDEREFKEWYRQRRNESGFSDADFRTLLRTTLLQMRMQEYLSERIPTVAEQVYINLISIGSNFELGKEIKAKYDAGADFAALAREYSVDSQLKESGGKFGWFPEGALDTTLNNTAFKLEVGECSDPFYIDDESSVLMMVSDRVEAREIDGQSMELLKSKVLEKWFNEESRNNDVHFYGFSGGGYDSATDAWVQWQLYRMQRGQKGEEDSAGAASSGQSPNQATGVF